jgi:hypothetical protein
MTATPSLAAEEESYSVRSLGAPISNLWGRSKGRRIFIVTNQDVFDE